MAQLKHQRVLVLERHFRLGGFTHSFTRPGHRAWDVGLHYGGGMAAGETGRQLLDLVTRRGVRWQKMPSPFEKFVYPDFTFDVPDDETSYRQALIARYPHERATIETYFRDLHAVSGWFGAQIFAQAVPGIMAALIRIASRPRRALALSTTAAYLDERVHDPQLKAVLASQWGDYGLPPSESAFAIHALVVASYLGGGYYPIGGAGTIARSVADIVAANGGQCLADHRVAEIIISHGAAVGVRVESNGRHDAEVHRTPCGLGRWGVHDLLPPVAAECADSLQGGSGTSGCRSWLRHAISRVQRESGHAGLQG